MSLPPFLRKAPKLYLSPRTRASE